MATLQDLKIRIGSVKSTQKITKAMKMVAAAKLRRAREAAENSRPYAEAMERMVTTMAQGADPVNAPVLMVGNGKNDIHLMIVASGDRGLCGAFNSSIARSARAKIKELELQGKTVKIITIGKKSRELLKTEHGNKFVATFEDFSKGKLAYDRVFAVLDKITAMFEAGEFDVCEVVYNHFKSPILQIVTHQQLIPLPMDENTDDTAVNAQYEYEPDEETILADLLPRNLGIQIFKALLENAASEQGSRMTAMDNATRNAGEMIDDLTLQYNRSRQAAITKELIEIISGAQAV